MRNLAEREGLGERETYRRTNKIARPPSRLQSIMTFDLPVCPCLNSYTNADVMIPILWKLSHGLLRGAQLFLNFTNDGVKIDPATLLLKLQPNLVGRGW